MSYAKYFDNQVSAQKAQQKGLSLVEISVVTVIILLVAVLAIPVIQGYLVENQVPKVGEALANFVLRQHLNAHAHGAPRYEGMNQGHFALQNASSPVFTYEGVGGQPTIRHGLGNSGELSIAELEGGRALELRLTGVHHAACPSLATVMNRVVDEIHIGEQGQLVEVKSPQRDYSAFYAQQQCGEGENNVFSFVVR